MEPGPHARYGHTLSTSQQKIIVLGGESMANVNGTDESTMAFVFDTARIRFPSDDPLSENETVRTLYPSVGALGQQSEKDVLLRFLQNEWRGIDAVVQAKAERGVIG